MEQRNVTRHWLDPCNSCSCEAKFGAEDVCCQWTDFRDQRLFSARSNSRRSIMKRVSLPGVLVLVVVSTVCSSASTAQAQWVYPAPSGYAPVMTYRPAVVIQPVVYTQPFVAYSAPYPSGGYGISYGGYGYPAYGYGVGPGVFRDRYNYGLFGHLNYHHHQFGPGYGHAHYHARW